MKRIVLPMVAVGVGIVAIGAVPGCGGGEGFPDDAVAEVGDTAITKSEFERALRFATGRDNDPRDVAACVAAKEQPAGEAGATLPSEAELEAQCRRDYEQIKSNVMDYLIKAEWIRQEAEARGVVLTDAEAKQALDEAEQGGFLDVETMSRAGVSERELITRLRQNRLQSKVMEQVTERARQVSGQDIEDYYRRHRAELVVPERRDVRIVLTRSHAKAQAARAALDTGRSWDTVAKEYSSHTSRNEGGRITAEWRREDKTGLGAAIFRASRGKLVGPVNDDGTWAVFVVNTVKPSDQPTLEQARGEIVEQLQPARVQRAVAAYTRKYRAQTTCAPGFKVAGCKNGPKPADDQPSA